MQVPPAIMNEYVNSMHKNCCCAFITDYVRTTYGLLHNDNIVITARPSSCNRSFPRLAFTQLPH